MANNRISQCTSLHRKNSRRGIKQRKVARWWITTIPRKRVRRDHVHILTTLSTDRLRVLVQPVVRSKGAGFYQFAQDEEIRKEQMERLKKERDVTEQARSREGTDDKEGPSLSAAQAAKKRKMDERRALIEAKRQKVSRPPRVD
jgi:hypothetical protein